MSEPFIIGITGGIGGGKSTFSQYLRRLGYMVYDTDLEARILQNSNQELVSTIKREFGEDIYDAKGLNRSKLAGIVFPNPEKLKVLNNIVHPAVKKDFLNWVKKYNNEKFLFMECAILYEGGFDALVDRSVVVSAPESVRIERVMKRDNVSEEAVRVRISNQMDEKQKIGKADWYYDTNNNVFPHERIKSFLGMLEKSMPD